MNALAPCSDDGIVRALHADDPGAMDRLVAEYWLRLVRYADGILAGEAGAEDVVQESFLRLWTRRRQLRLGGSLRALLFTLTRNGAVDARRTSARWAAKAVSVPAPTTPPSPLDAAAASELAATATAAVSHLPARRRQIFVLVRLHGLSYREAAASLGVAPQTVANQMCAALTTLRTALALPTPTTNAGGMLHAGGDLGPLRSLQHRGPFAGSGPRNSTEPSARDLSLGDRAAGINLPSRGT